MAPNLSVASFIPYLELPSAPFSAPVQLRESGGKISVLVAVHSARCPGCQDYLKGLGPLSAEFEAWDARLLIVIPEPISEAQNTGTPFGKVLSDEDHRFANAGAVSVQVADRYGQIFESVHAGSSHELLTPGEVAESLKYIGTLCPE
jgi:peroxiredoxin